MRRISLVLLFFFLTSLSSGCSVLLPMFNGETPSQQAPAPGDPVHGEQLYRLGKDDAPPCIGCHALTAGTFSLGPTFKGSYERAGRRVAGLSADAYIHQSIVAPQAYIVPGYRIIMYTDYAKHLSEQDIADLIAFLRTQ